MGTIPEAPDFKVSYNKPLDPTKQADNPQPISNGDNDMAVTKAPKKPEQTQPERKVIDINETPAVTYTNGGNKVTVFGCGGFGANMVRLLHKSDFSDIGLEKLPPCCILDTSTSNFYDIPEGVICHQIAENGSGKDRAANIDPTMMYLKDQNIDSDLNIVIFSLNGGSGSVIGPLLANHIKSNGKAVILVTVFDTVGRFDINNTNNTLKTLDHLAKQDKRYFPLIMFDNKRTQRSETDMGVVAKLGTLLDLLIGHQIQEIDLADLKGFLSPKGQSGLYMADVGYMNEDNTGIAYSGEVTEILDENTICHSTISINKQATPFQSLTQVAYAGIGPRNIEGFVGLPVPEHLVGDIQRTLREQSTFVVNATDLGDDGDTHTSGIVL